MCDISPFLLSSPTVDITVAHLAQLFMSDVIMIFGMCLVMVVVIDDGSSFKGVFIGMCEVLDLTYWCLSWAIIEVIVLSDKTGFVIKRKPL